MMSEYTFTKVKWDGNPATERCDFIGGSDVGSIMGCNPWKSAYTLWAEKTGQIAVPDISDKEAVWWGNYDEEGVARRFCEKTGKKVRRSLMSYGVKEIPYFRGHVDRLVVGEPAGLECKTTSAFNRTDYDNAEIPPYHYWQCMFYIFVTNSEYWYYAVKRNNNQFYIQKVDRDEDAISLMIEKCRDFWKHVQDKTPPEVDGSESTTDTLSQLHPAENAKEDDLTIDLGEKIAEAAEEASKRKDLIKDLKSEETYYENVIREAMGDYQKAYAGKYRFDWKAQTRSGGIDAKMLKDQYPATYAACKKPDTTSRIFRYRKVKEKESD